MENKDLVFNPQAEVINFGVVDIVSKSQNNTENETDQLPPEFLL